MTKLVQYIGNADEKTISSAELASHGITSPDLVFSKSEEGDYFKSVPDIVAMFLLSQGDFEAFDGSTITDIFENNASPEAEPEVLSVQIGDDEPMSGSVVLPAGGSGAQHALRKLGYDTGEAMPGTDDVRIQAIRNTLFSGDGREVLVADDEGVLTALSLPEGTVLASTADGMVALSYAALEALIETGGAGFSVADLSDTDVTSKVDGYVITYVEATDNYVLRPIPTLPVHVTLSGGRIGSKTIESEVVDGIAGDSYDISDDTTTLTFNFVLPGTTANLILPEPEFGTLMVLKFEASGPVTVTAYVTGETTALGEFEVEAGEYVFAFPRQVEDDEDFVPSWNISGIGSGGAGGGSSLLPPNFIGDTLDLEAGFASMTTTGVPFSDDIYVMIPLDLDAPIGTVWYFTNTTTNGMGIWPADEGSMLVDSVTGDRGVAQYGMVRLWKADVNNYILSGDLVPIDAPPDPDPDPPAEPMMFFRMSADSFDRVDAPTLGAPDDGIPVLYEYEGDGTWEVSDNSAVFTGGSAGKHAVFCDTAGFGTLTFVVGEGDVGTTSELRIIVGNVYDDATLTGDAIVLNEAGEFIQIFGGVEETEPVFTLTDFPGFVVGEEVKIAWEYDGIFSLGFRVTVGSIFDQFIGDYPASPPGFGDYIGFEVTFVTGQLPKTVDFWEVSHPANSMLVPKAFAGTRVDNIEGGATTGPPVDATSYNGTWDWLEGSPWTDFGTPGYNAHYNALSVTEGDNRYVRLQFDVASVDQFVAGGFRVLKTRRDVDPTSEIVRRDGLTMRASATEWLALVFSDDAGTSGPRLFSVTDSGATETLLHTFGSPMLDALNIPISDAGWATVRAFVGADDIFWLQINGVTESVDLSAETLPAGTEVGVLHRQTVDGALDDVDRGIGWWTFDGYALV